MQTIQEIKRKLAQLAKGGFFHVLCGNTLVKMIAFISSIVIVRLVDKDQYAYLTYADNLYNYVAAFAGLGMTSAILKFCAIAKSKEEDKAYFVFAMKYGTMFQLLLSLVIILYAIFGNIPFPQAKIIIYILILYPLLMNVLNTIMSYVRAHGENKLYINLAIIQTLIVFAGSIFFVVWMGIKGIAWARYIALAISILCSIKFLKMSLGGVKTVKLSSREIKAFMVMSLSMMISSLFTLIMPINEMTMVNQLLRNEVITANYKVAIMIPGQLSFITQSILVYFFTIVAKMDDGQAIWKLAKKVTAGTTVFIVAVSAIGVICSPFLIRTVYGDRYEDAITLSVIFWIVYGFNAAIRMIPMDFLLAMGIAKFNAVLAAVSCGIHLVLTYFAICLWGIWGAGIATGFIYICSAIAFWIYLRNKCLNA